MIPPRWTVGIAVGPPRTRCPHDAARPGYLDRSRAPPQAAAAVARGEKIASGFGGDQGFSHGYPAYMTEAVLRLSLRCDRTAPRRTREALDLIDWITSIREDAKARRDRADHRCHYAFGRHQQRADQGHGNAAPRSVDDLGTPSSRFGSGSAVPSKRSRATPARPANSRSNCAPMADRTCRRQSRRGRFLRRPLGEP